MALSGASVNVGSSLNVVLMLNNSGGDLSSATGDLTATDPTAVTIVTLPDGCVATQPTSASALSLGGKYAVATCTLGPLGGGTSLTLAFVVQAVGPANETLSFSCPKCATFFTAPVANATFVLPTADFQVSFTSAVKKPVVGTNVTATGLVTNLGPYESPARVSFAAPTGITLLSADTVGGNCTAGGCTLPVLKNGASASISVTLRVDKPGAHVVRAAVGIPQGIEINAANSSAALTITGVAKPSKR